MKFGTQVTLSGVVEQQAGRRDGHDRGAAVRADHEAGRRHAANHARRCVHVQRDASAEHDVPGAVEGRGKLGRRPGPADGQAAVRRRKSGYFHFYVTAGQSFAGRFVFLQRFTLTKTWINVRPPAARTAVRPDHGDEIRRARGSRAGAGRSGSTCRRARCPAVTSTRGAARSQSSSADAPRERGLLVRALVPLLNGVPVDDVPPGLEIFGPAVLVLQVVGVLPHVDAEQRDVRVRDR